MRRYPLEQVVRPVIRRVVRSPVVPAAIRKHVNQAAARWAQRAVRTSTGPWRVRGHLMRLTDGLGYPPPSMLLDRYEEATSRVFEQLVRPGDAVVDVGAHVGYYTLLAARATGPTGTVYAFEPNPSTYGLLNENVKLNNYHHVVTIQQAVMDRCGSSMMILGAQDNGVNSLYHTGRPERAEQLAVATTTLDAFFEREGWPQISVIKMDIEGAEMAALSGMTRLMERQTALKLIVEFHPAVLQHAGVDPGELLGRLLALEFRLSRITDSGQVVLDRLDEPAWIARLQAQWYGVNLLCVRP